MATATTLPPSQDPWYAAPVNLLAYPVGSIIKIRADPLKLYAAIGTHVAAASYNILYRTTDHNHMPAFAVTTLFIPTLKSTKNGLLSYQIPYNTPNVDASPSWVLESEYSSLFPRFVAALQQGWYLSVTDFEGPHAIFAVGVAEGYAVLDGIRAVTQSHLSPATTTPDAAEWRISLSGYSGGAIATELAAELQSTYAPDISIAGVAIGGLPTPVANVLDSVNTSPFACLMVLGLWGYANAYPVFESYLLGRLTPEAKESGVFTKGRSMNFETAVPAYFGADIYSYFIGGREDIQSSELVAHVMDMQGVMGLHGLPTMPMFVYKAIDDRFSVVGNTDKLVEKYAEAGNAQVEIGHGKGVRIWYERNKIGGHVAEHVNGSERAMQFLVRAMNGELGDQWPNGHGQGVVVRDVAVGNETAKDW